MTLSEERQLSSFVPYAITDPTRIPRERYFDRAFYDLEKEKLWGHTWQMACRLEDIPDAGDYYEYEICGQSVLVVRQNDSSIKAYENACRHRATQLALGSGRFGGGQIVCPFHGWRWDIDGSLSYMFQSELMPPECVADPEFALQECLVDTWGGCAWINFDPDARPLAEALAPASAVLDGVHVANMRVKFWKEIILNANWKIAQEAFHEGIHLAQTHPQLAFGQAQAWRDPLIYTAMENGHGSFHGGMEEMPAEAFIALARMLWQGQDAMALEREFHLFEGLRNKVPADENFPTAAIRAYYDYAEGAGLPPMPPLENTGIWGGEVFLFPNFFMLPMFANCLSYRIRPYNDDPEWCRFEIWSLQTFPEGHEPRKRPVKQPVEQDDAEHLGQIPRQDFSNIERQQRGLHTPRFENSRLYPRNESLITNMHQELDRYLAR